MKKTLAVRLVAPGTSVPVVAKRESESRTILWGHFYNAIGYLGTLLWTVVAFVPGAAEQIRLLPLGPVSEHIDTIAIACTLLIGVGHQMKALRRTTVAPVVKEQG